MSKRSEKTINKNTAKTAKRLLKYVTDTYKLQFILVFVCIFISAAASVSVSLSLKFMLDDFILPLVGQSNPDFTNFYHAMIVLGCIFAAGVIATFIYTRMMVFIGQGVLKRVRDDMFEHMQTLPIRYFDQNTNGSIMSLYTNDTDTLRQMISQAIPQALMSFFTIIVTFISMLVLSPILTILAVVVIGIMITVTKAIGGNSGKYFIRQQKSLADVTGFIEERMNGQRVVKVFNHERKSEEEFDKLNESLFESAANANKYANIMGPVVGNIGNLQFVLTAVLGGVLAIEGIGGITLGVMASYLQFTKSFTQPFMQVAQQFNSIVMALAGAGILAVSMMTGCGSSSSTASTTAAATTTAAAAETAKEAATTAAEKKADLTGSITAAGSSALKPLVDDAADMFIEKYPDVSITIDAGGSGEGLKQVSEGTVNIGNSDVEASAKLDETQAKELVDHQVCVVTMAPIVNNDVKEGGVEDLTKQQLIDIFTGKTTNWKEVGGPDESIVLVTRPTSSGTRATFQKYALDGNEEASNTSMETDDSGVLLQNVKDTKGAIGYVALSYLTGDAGVATVAIDGAEPTLENTYAGKYPVWTFEHMYTKGEPDEVVSAFLDYIMSDEYGAKMESLGYGVSSKMTNTEH